MVAENEGVALLSLAAKKGLIAADSAVGIKRQIESGLHGPGAGAKPIAEMLVKDGHITATQADLLLSELAKAHGPKVVGGHQLVSKLGQGGMGAVYKAIQLSMQREVALKVLTPALARDKDFIERFIREARAAGKVIHPNVISCFDVGMDNGMAYMSLELVSGGDALKRSQAAGGKLQEREALEIIRDCAHGLAAIAKAGLIHRDIKPANIFLTADGHAKLADLGLARSSSGDDRMTQTGTAVGSPAYMAPEQAKGIHDVDIRADIYSLGATLYHLLCGQPPFVGSSVFATVNKVINEPTPDPRVLTPAISAASTALIRVAMAKDRAQRYQTPEELAKAVEAVLAGKTPAARSGPHAPAHGHAHAHAAGARVKPVAGKRPVGALYVVGGLATVGLLVGMAMLVGGRSPEPVRAEAPVAVAAPARAPAPTPVVAPAPVVAAPDAETGTVARGALPGLVELVAERREGARGETEAPSVASATQPLVSEPAPPAAPVATARPEWAGDGVKVLDLALAGDLAGAASAAKALPAEFPAAIAALQAARKDLTKVYLAHQVAILAAKPKLPSLKDDAMTGMVEKGVDYSLKMGGDSRLNWLTLKAEDHAALRAAVPNPALTADQQRVLARVDLNATNLDSADAGDPAVAALQRLAQLKSELAAEAKLAADAERRRTALLGSVAIDWQALAPRTQRTLTNLAAVTTFAPTVIAGVIDRRIELRDFVVIRSDATLAPGGQLIPCSGAVVINVSPRVFYEAMAVNGVPFISCSLLPTQTRSPRGVERGRLFTNSVFYGNVLLDGVHSPRFQDCAFIGGADPGTREAQAWDAQTQRDGQFLNCDFHRLRLRCGLPIAASDKCSFSACELAFPAFAMTPKGICAWDPQGALQAQLTTIGLPLRVHAQEGRPVTLLGADVEALAKALDQVVAVWVPKLRLGQ